MICHSHHPISSANQFIKPELFCSIHFFFMLVLVGMGWYSFGQYLLPSSAQWDMSTVYKLKRTQIWQFKCLQDICNLLHIKGNVLCLSLFLSKVRTTLIWNYVQTTFYPVTFLLECWTKFCSSRLLTLITQLVYSIQQCVGTRHTRQKLAGISQFTYNKYNLVFFVWNLLFPY